MKSEIDEFFEDAELFTYESVYGKKEVRLAENVAKEIIERLNRSYVWGTGQEIPFPSDGSKWIEIALLKAMHGELKDYYKNDLKEAKKYWAIKYKKRIYSWPCESDLTRTIEIFGSDILSKNSDGTYFKHTGVGCFGIEIPDEDLEVID
tara:strand:- start:82 stop:528 length:447 start_codon:yes stop_codon:yes gene_type:complete